MKNRLTLIIGIVAILMVGVAILGYYLGTQQYDDASAAVYGGAKTSQQQELQVEFAPNGMPMDLYLEEQQKAKSSASSKDAVKDASEFTPKKGVGIITDAKTIIAREEAVKERARELKKFAEKYPDSEKALSEERIKRMEELGLSEQ